MRNRFLTILSLLAVAFCVAYAHADDQVANPKFAAWAKYGVGSSQTIEGDVTRGAVTVHSKTISTLKEVADDHVVVTVQSTVNVNGEDRVQPERDETIPAKTDAEKYQTVGEEDVTAAGKTFKCQVLEFHGNSGAGAPGAGQDMTAKAWFSTDVPGGTVKISVSGAMTMNLMLTAFEVK